jgi:hypothetical protein
MKIAYLFKILFSVLGIGAITISILLFFNVIEAENIYVWEVVGILFGIVMLIFAFIVNIPKGEEKQNIDTHWVYVGN